MSDFLDKLAAGPLGDPNKLFLPKGRRSPHKKRTPEELELFREERQAKRDRLEREHRGALDALAAYYAKTEVPLDRVAKHLNVTREQARKRLAEHGRKA